MLNMLSRKSKVLSFKTEILNLLSADPYFSIAKALPKLYTVLQTPSMAPLLWLGETTLCEYTFPVDPDS